MINNNKILITVVIPVYNTKKELLFEALNSAANQTLDKNNYELLIVDDCSTNPETLEFLNQLNQVNEFERVPLKIIRHKENKWSAEARNTGAKNAKGKYIVFLDSDDLIKKDYLKKAALLLETSPRAGWVYPDTRMFGYFDYFIPAPKFNALKLFFVNYCGSATLYRKSAWLQAPQREKFVVGNIRFFEDWDTLIRLMAKGWYGLPLNDSEFRYRQNYKSNVIRTPRILNLTKYVVWRCNILSFLKIFKAQINYLKDFKSGFKKRRSFLNPNKYLNFISSLIIERVVATQSDTNITGPPKEKPDPETKLGLKRKRNIQAFFPFKLFFYSIFIPQKFIKKYLDLTYSRTAAELGCGFLEKPKINFIKTVPENNKGNKKTIIFAHPWWQFGGAENILLDWIKGAKRIADIKIIDLVENSLDEFFLRKENELLKQDFSNYTDEQYALDRIAETPLRKLKFCWNLIVKERPDILFIYGNNFFYTLLPLIKKELPFIKVVDILHLERHLDISWFAISDDYKEYIDKRIVTSDAWKEALIKKYQEKENKISVYNNVVDLNRYNPFKYNKPEIKESFGVDSNKFVIGFIGRLHFQKNPLVFLELANLMKEDGQFEFIMVGGGEIEEKIKEKLKSLPNLKFFGYSQDIPRYIAMSDLLICPSLFEGSPLIGLEAAAMNIPIIATDVIGFREQIELGRFGFLYQQKDTLTDARKIKEMILENKNRFPEIGKNGRNFVLKHHNSDKGVEDYKNFIAELISS